MPMSYAHGAGRAASAQSRGCFHAEIVPVTTTVLDDKGDKKTITVSQDEGVRPSTTMQGLAKLKPAFKDGGSTTAGERRPGVRRIVVACSTLRPGADQAPWEGDGGGLALLGLA